MVYVTFDVLFLASRAFDERNKTLVMDIKLFLQINESEVLRTLICSPEERDWWTGEQNTYPW